MTSLSNLKCSEFIDAAASKEPVPGGGGVSALTGALGTALGNMVGELTVGKKKYEMYEAEIKDCMEKAAELMHELEACIDEDAKAFEPLAKVYQMPKDTPGYEELKEKCLKEAAAAPLKILELSCRSLELLKVFGDKGSVLTVSDAATGAGLVRGAVMGAAVNVKVNTRLMKDRVYAKELDDRVDDLREFYVKLADEIYESVYSRLS